MLKFPKEITSEFFEYTTELSLAQLRAEIESVINDTNSFSLSANFSGKIIKDNEYQITSNWEIGPMVSGPLGYINANSPTSLNVFIYQNKNAKTQVNLLVSPNSYLPSLFIFFPISLLVLVGTSINDTGINEADLILMLMIFLCPVIILFISKFSKKRLRNKFVKHFDLQEIS